MRNDQLVKTFLWCLWFLLQHLSPLDYSRVKICWCLLHKVNNKKQNISSSFHHSVNPVSLHYFCLWFGLCCVQPLCCKLIGLITEVIHHQNLSLYREGTEETNISWTMRLNNSAKAGFRPQRKRLLSCLQHEFSHVYSI